MSAGIFVHTVLLLGAALIVASQTTNAPRGIKGISVDTLRRFPHHVTIEPNRDWSAGYKLCGGSILNEQWILTSALCVDGSQRLQVHFEKLYYASAEGSYTAVVNSDAVHIYPTYYDDIALVKLPFKLVFSDTLKAVNFSRNATQLDNILAVLPGFDGQDASNNPGTPSDNAAQATTLDYFPNGIPNGLPNNVYDRTKQLTYGMLGLLSNDKCKTRNFLFDEYLQICTVNWTEGTTGACNLSYGSGLLLGWPARSQLIGIFSATSSGCGSSTAIYTNVAKYASWIESVING